jgi:hypothetical protein
MLYQVVSMLWQDQGQTGEVGACRQALNMGSYRTARYLHSRLDDQASMKSSAQAVPSNTLTQKSVQ